jgi:hypothetical protein
MPEISRFLGIVIRMYIHENAPAHFHAEYGEYEITVDIETGKITGKFPKRALNVVLEWHMLHKDELMANWEAAMNRKPLSKIKPLE